MAYTYNPFTGKLDQTAASGGGGLSYDQLLNTTNNVTFNNVSVSSTDPTGTFTYYKQDETQNDQIWAQGIGGYGLDPNVYFIGNVANTAVLQLTATGDLSINGGINSGGNIVASGTITAPNIGTAASKGVPVTGNATSTQVVLGSDTRLTDSRTPTAHTHPLSALTQSSATIGQVPSWNGTAWVASDQANYDQSLNTADSVTFADITATGTISATNLPDQSLNMTDDPLFKSLSIDTYVQYSPTNGLAVPIGSGITYFDTTNNSFYGYISGLSSGLRKFTMGNASDLTSGTLDAARLPSTAVTTTGTQTLTNKSISSGQITGLASVSTSGSASDLTTGTLSDSRLSSNVLLLTGSQTITGTKTLTPAAGSSALIASNVTHTTSAPILDLTQTWNASAVAFSALKLSVTNTASTTASTLLDLSVGGTSQLHVTPAKQIRLFNARVDASNYECGVLDWTTNSNALTIGTQKAGTGTARRVRLNSSENIDYYISDSSRVFQMATNGNISFSPMSWQYYSGAGDPTTSTTPWNNGASYCALWRNTTTGVVKLWVNNAGTMVSVALA
jgi:hypothetical protein